jgi:hypothetical protein
MSPPCTPFVIGSFFKTTHPHLFRWKTLVCPMVVNIVNYSNQVFWAGEQRRSQSHSSHRHRGSDLNFLLLYHQTEHRTLPERPFIQIWRRRGCLLCQYQALFDDEEYCLESAYWAQNRLSILNCHLIVESNSLTTSFKFDAGHVMQSMCQTGSTLPPYKLSQRSFSPHTFMAFWYRLSTGVHQLHPFACH